MGARPTRRNDDPPRFDGPRFARFLKRWKEAEGFEWGELADKAQLSYGSVQTLGAGQPRPHQQRAGQQVINPSINTIAALAHGLGLDLGYVLAKAGLSSSTDRWHNFTRQERTRIASVLAVAAQHDPAMQELHQELAKTLQENDIDIDTNVDIINTVDIIDNTVDIIDTTDTNPQEDS